MSPVGSHPGQKPDPKAELSRLIDVARQLENGAVPAYLEAGRVALHHAEANGSVPLELHLQALCEYGNALRSNGDLAAALESLNRVIEAAETLPSGIGRQAILGNAHLRLAVAHDMADEISAAFEALQQATGQFEAAFDEQGMYRAKMLRGALYARIDDFEHAEECFRRCLEFYRRTGNPERIGSALSNLSAVLRRMARHKEAIAMGREATQLAGSLLLRTLSLGNLAFALAADGQLDEARGKATEVLALAEKLGNPDHTSKYMRATASVMRAQGLLNEARDMLERALELADAHDCRRNAVLCRGLLSEVHRDLGDFESAYNCLVAYHGDMLASSRRKAISQLEIQKWRLEIDNARDQAKQERERRRHLAESPAELNDMHEQLAAHAVQLELTSHRDELTGIANRRYFDVRLAREAEQSKDFDEGVSLIMLDIDEFKRINDRWGHPIGDEVLRRTARLLRKGVRRSDLCARLGGEEFAVLLTSDVEPEELWHLSEQLRRAIQDHEWDAIAPGLGVTVSIGSASLTEVEHDPTRLLELSDRRLYQAKRAGRNRVVSTPFRESQVL